MQCLAALLFLFLVGCSDSARKVGETGAAPAIQFPVGEVAGDKLGASICLSALEIVSRHKAVWRCQPSRTPAITEMIVQSHERVIDLIPAVPAEWGTGQFDGVRVRGGFELNVFIPSMRSDRFPVQEDSMRPMHHSLPSEVQSPIPGRSSSSCIRWPETQAP